MNINRTVAAASKFGYGKLEKHQLMDMGRQKNISPWIWEARKTLAHGYRKLEKHQLMGSFSKCLGYPQDLFGKSDSKYLSSVLCYK